MMIPSPGHGDEECNQAPKSWRCTHHLLPIFDYRRLPSISGSDSVEEVAGKSACYGAGAAVRMGLQTGQGNAAESLGTNEKSKGQATTWDGRTDTA